MTYPALPEIETSYTAFQQAQGDNSFPGAQLDVDLDNLKNAIDGWFTFSRRVIRSDMELGNQTVGAEQLKPGLILGIEPPTGWLTGTSYSVGDTVFAQNGYYICTVAHVSGTFASDLASDYWFILIDFGPYIEDAIEEALEGVIQDIVDDAVEAAIGNSQLMRHVSGLDALNAIDASGLTAAHHMSNATRNGIFVWDTIGWSYNAVDPEQMNVIYNESGQPGAWVNYWSDPRAGYFTDSEPVPARKLRVGTGIFTGLSGANYYGAFSDTEKNENTAFWAHDVGTEGNWAWVFATAANIFEKQGGKVNTSIISESAETGGGLTIGLQVSVVGIHVDEEDTHGVWGIYGDAIAMPGHDSNLRNFEFNIVNKALDITDEMSEKPYTSRSNYKFGGAFASGGDVTIHGASYPADEAIRINQNGGTFWTAMMIRNNALERDENDEARAITMAVGHALAWFGPGDNPLGRIVFNNTAGHQWRMAFSDTELGLTFRNKRVIRLDTDDDGVNYLQTGQSITGEAVRLTAAGDDTDIDMHINPKGSGVIQIGVVLTSVTAAAKTTSRWLPFKDANGVTRYIPVSDTAS